MKIVVHLHSTLQVQTADGPKRRLELDLENGQVVRDLVDVLKLEIDPERLLIGINGEAAKLEDVLHSGDRVHLMLPVSGG